MNLDIRPQPACCQRQDTIRKPRRQVFQKRAEEPYRVNRKILASKVRLVGENVKLGVYPLKEALEIASEQALDLVEISPKAEPPVCKVIDYAKFKYGQKKKKKAQKVNLQKVVTKEVRFGPNTSEHDFNFKLKHATKFIQEGSRVKVVVRFAGRAIVFKERGEVLLLKFAQALEDYVKVEHLPRMEGRRMILILSPKLAKD